MCPLNSDIIYAHLKSEVVSSVDFRMLCLYVSKVKSDEQVLCSTFWFWNEINQYNFKHSKQIVFKKQTFTERYDNNLPMVCFVCDFSDPFYLQSHKSSKSKRYHQIKINSTIIWFLMMKTICSCWGLLTEFAELLVHLAKYHTADDNTISN